MMRKNLRRLAVLLAASMLVGIVAGCGNGNQASQGNSSQSGSVSKESSAQPEGNDTQSQAEAEEFSYPMEGEHHLTWAEGIDKFVQQAGYDNMSDTEFIKAATEMTGVEIEYIHGEGSEWLPMMIAEGDYPDIIAGWWQFYPDQIKGAGQDGVIIPLDDVIDQYMPNFKAFLEANRDDPSIGVMYNGADKIYGIPFAYESNNITSTTGLMVRKDWLDELNLEVPETMDEWHDVLTAFKENYPDCIPFTCTLSIAVNGAFCLAYNIDRNNSNYAFCYIDPETEEIVSGLNRDEYRELLTTMNQWYEEGLIDPDIVAMGGNFSTVVAKLKNGNVGSAQVWNADVSAYEYEYVAAPNPSRHAGEEVCFSNAANRFSACWATITSKCEDVEAAARYLDFFWSEEGIRLANYGKEGVTYTMVDGEPEYTEEYLNATPDERNALIATYGRAQTAFPGLRADGFVLKQLTNEAERDSYTTWGSRGTIAYRLPSTIAYTQEEADEIAKLNADLLTYANEMMAKFILGSEDIETGWDEYVKTLDDTFKLQREVELIRGAYERTMGE